MLTHIPSAPVLAAALGLVLAAAAAPAGDAAAQGDDTLVVLHTEQGRLVVELFPQDAPNHAANFVELARSGYYDDTLFHRIISGFMIQGGDPNTKPGAGPESLWGTGGPDTHLAAEFNSIMHNRGIVSMARSAHPDSAGSQFFVVHRDSNFLDTQYTVFGRLATEESYATLDAVAGLATVQNDRPASPDAARITAAEVIARSQAAASGLELLEQGPPDRTAPIEVPDAEAAGAYESEDLNLSMEFPVGWVVQELSGEGNPNVVAVSPPVGPLPSSIAVQVESAGGRSLDEVVADKLDLLESRAAEGAAFQIVGRETATVNGRQAFVLEAVDSFVFSGTMVDIKHRDVTMVAADRVYTFVLSSDTAYFDLDLPAFDESLRSFGVLDESAEPMEPVEPMEPAEPVEPVAPAESPEPEGDAQTPFGGGCLIATAAFGSELAPQVQQLRELRDNDLLQTRAGSGFVEWFNTAYYAFSPAVADYERANPAFREAVRVSITPMISALSVLNHVDMDTEASAVAYGTSAILLVLASYLGAPASALFILRGTFRSGAEPVGVRRAAHP